jgi:hypothetical protein
MRRTVIRVLPLDQIESEFDRRRAGGAPLVSLMLSNLRDVAGGGARKRAIFHAPGLRQRLLHEFDVSISEPSEWGLSTYRSTLKRLARIEIPGSAISGSVDTLFVWPKARIYDDPMVQRKTEKTASRDTNGLLFREVAAKWHEHWKDGNSAHHVKATWSRLESNVFPV